MWLPLVFPVTPARRVATSNAPMRSVASATSVSLNYFEEVFLIRSSHHSQSCWNQVIPSWQIEGLTLITIAIWSFFKYTSSVKRIRPAY